MTRNFAIRQRLRKHGSVFISISSNSGRELQNIIIHTGSWHIHLMHALADGDAEAAATNCIKN